MTVQRSPYGAWESPITVEHVAGGDGRVADLGAVGGELWWTEPRPAEGGRRALMRQGASALPAPWNVRNRVHEYGGRPWAGVDTGNGPLIVFSEFADQRLYAFEPDRGLDPWPLTPVPAIKAGLRWCDMVVDTSRGEVWAVLEEFTGPRTTEVRRVIAAVPLDGSAAEDRSAVRELTDDSYRFTTGPRMSPQGTMAAWIAWNHPNMPWDETELRVAAVTAEGDFADARTVAGGGGESIAQVEWDADGTLVAVGDRTGWWNLHRIDPASGASANLHPAQQEFGGPLWAIGQRWFQILDNGRIAAVHGEGEARLGILDPELDTLREVDGPWTEWAPSLLADGDRVVGLAAGPDRSFEIVEHDTATGVTRTVAAPHVDKVDPAYYPVPGHRTFTAPGGREVHARLYPPRNPEYEAPEGELPPYVVWVHGGPTSNVRAVLDLELAYFTSRGIGVVQVDYGGSTGYGREYRERLRGQWGVVDVEDCAAAAKALADEGVADPSRLAIRGGSAGGWTSAASLTSPAAEGLYACATIKYPILDLSIWLGDETHDFESQYLHTLIGPVDEVSERYRERSPINHADRISVPFLLLQGLEDAICLPAQSEKLLRAIAGKGVPHAYRTYEGEQHGFRKASTIADAVSAEHALYAQTFGFAAPEGADLELRS
ncbi:prolyl oligopeptidase family serine peptidase [Glycomyces sp. L485]|uniref:prolyl oligopeptidase family serine peptidase n=1 Tax=Glycomyces sp. L485 TaxID=2909235 RepID=UPI001F4B33D7|nr:prolyl oligopeptidase family serine peptidase [Glycomyces sp. L485]MCH7230841.1 prolyl oligopeptidase family serine peptidase [Glycomyces sp. L485]